MITGVWHIPWTITQKMEEIKSMISQLNFQIQHIFREANQLADHIANTVSNQENSRKFLSFNQLTSKGKSILVTDKKRIPTVRIKTRKIKQQAHGDNEIQRFTTTSYTPS